MTGANCDLIDGDLHHLHCMMVKTAAAAIEHGFVKCIAHYAGWPFVIPVEPSLVAKPGEKDNTVGVVYCDLHNCVRLILWGPDNQLLNPCSACTQFFRDGGWRGCVIPSIFWIFANNQHSLVGHITKTAFKKVCCTTSRGLLACEQSGAGLEKVSCL